MPAAARAILRPSASAHAAASASADRNRLWCRSVKQKIARKRAEKHAMPETCGNRDGMHGVARKCERGMQACECGGVWTGVPNKSMGRGKLRVPSVSISRWGRWILKGLSSASRHVQAWPCRNRS